MVVRLMEWCGQYIPFTEDCERDRRACTNERTIEAAGGDPIVYLTLLAEREAYFCGATKGTEEVEYTDWLDDDEDFGDFPLDKGMAICYNGPNKEGKP